MKGLVYLVLMIITVSGFGQVNVIPMPQDVVMKDGICVSNFNHFVLARKTKNRDVHNNIMEVYEDYIMHDKSKSWTFTNLKLIIKVNLIDGYDKLIGAEGYHLTVSPDTISIAANNSNGLLYGFESLNQMIEASTSLDTAERVKYHYDRSYTKLPCCQITDYPAYSYRAMHLDVCRHFFSKEFVKDYIDYLVYYKINTFHWHLTDDQGWRIEIRKYPKLTGVGAHRKGKSGEEENDNGYYTQSDIRDIVKYATDRGITIIPEIEMPGHSSAALAAYPYLGCSGRQIDVPTTWGIKKDIYAPTDTVFKFFKDVMDEVCALFPGRYIHIGGDEAPKAQWKKSPIAQSVMKQNKLKNEEELQHYFMHRVEQYLQTKGKTAIGWGEVVKGGLSDSIVVMSWLNKEAGIKAAKHGNNVIMAPRIYCYFDYPQKGDRAKAWWMLPLPLEKVYKFDPIPKGLSAEAQKHILGGEATLWTEYVKTEKQALHQLIPRLPAMSEALWTKPGRKDFKSFMERLKALDALEPFNFL